MEFPRELCQAEFAALPVPRRETHQVARTAQPPRLPAPSPQESLTWRPQAARQSRSSGFSAHKGEELLALSALIRPCSCPGGWQLGALSRASDKPARRACLFEPALRGRGSTSFPTPRAGAQTRGSLGQRRAQAQCVGCWRWVFCFVLKPGVGEGQHLVNEKFPVRETLLAEFLSCP